MNDIINLIIFSLMIIIIIAFFKDINCKKIISLVKKNRN